MLNLQKYIFPQLISYNRRLATKIGDFPRSLNNKNVIATSEKIDEILKRSEIRIDFSHYIEDETLNVNCPIKSVYMNQLAANNPLEDRWNVGFTQVDGRVSSFLFTILDGHSGPACSHSLAWSLLDYVGASCLGKQKLESIKNYWKDDDQPFHIARRLELFGPNLKGHIATSPPENVRKMLTANLKIFIEDLLKRDKSEDLIAENMKEAMMRLDSVICSLGNIDRDKILDSNEFFKNFNAYKNKELVHLVSSGAVGQVGRIFWGNDKESNSNEIDLHVANVGDCSAFLLNKDPGGLAAISMNSIHQASVNPDEVDRIAQEHPNDQINQILRNGGRLLGELAPSRSFGDVRYKWPANRILQLIRIMNESGSNAPWSDANPLPSPYTSSPYLTAEPEVKKITLNRNSKYVVLATDGLWDIISGDDASKVLQNVSEGSSPATLLLKKALTTIPSSLAKVLDPDGKNNRNENLSLQHAAALLSLPTGIARYYRDDITVMVVELDVK